MENLAMDEILSVSDAPKQRFLVGDLVEVRMLEKGLRGSWHPAKVVGVHKGKRMVEYEELLDDDEKTKLREFILVGKASDGDNLMGTLPLQSPPKKRRPVLRPRPPPYPDSQLISWQEGVWVDCLYDDAWWEGVLAENITTVDMDDISLVTRKSKVEVLFPEEDDISQMSVNQMRIGQEWDEETGNWSLKGCVPVPVAEPNRKNRSKEDSSSEKPEQAVPSMSKGTDAAIHSAEPKATDTAIESEMCNNALALNTLIEDLCHNVEVVRDSVTCNSPGYGYEERLDMFRRGGGSSNISLNFGAQGPVNGCPATKTPPSENGNITEDAVEIEKVDFQSPLAKSNRAAQNEEAAQNVLTHAGWKITRNVRRKTGQVTWNCKSPKVAGAAVKTFSSLVEALSYETLRGAPDAGNLREAKSLLRSSFTNKKGGANEFSAARDTATGEDEDENDEYAVSAREILVRSGWEIFNGLRTGSGGESAWLYRTPGAGTQTRKWFKNWRLAIEEYVKQETSIPNQKKRGGPGKYSSPVPPKRVTRRLSSQEDANNAVNGSCPSFIKPEDSMFPVSSPGDYSDDDKREVDIVIHSGRKRTAVDLGQKFKHSDNTSSMGYSYLEEPFGSISNFMEMDNAYTLQVTTHDLLKEKISVIVEKGDILIKAKYGKEDQFDNIPIRYTGSVSSRLTLPKDVECQKITAELKSPLLTLRLPKCLTQPEDSIEIKIE